MRLFRGLPRAMAPFAALLLAACFGPPPAPAPSSGLPTSGVYMIGKPYEIQGVWYYPAEDYGYEETGLASWRPPGRAGQPTVNGEIRSDEELTAAHPTLPLPSLVRVTSLGNGRSIVVRVNDRGPAANGRIIELSRRAATLLGIDGTAASEVRLQILPDDSRLVAAAARRGTPQAVLAQTEGTAPRPAPREQVQLEGAAWANQPSPLLSAEIPPPSGVPGRMVDGRFLPEERVTQLAPRPAARLYIQLGAFGAPEAVARTRARVDALGEPVTAVQERLGRQTLTRLRVGPLGSVERADAALKRILEAGLTDAKIMVD